MPEPDDSAREDNLAYDLRQRARDDDYRHAYDAWVAGLSDDERHQLEELGLDQPSVPGAGTGAPSRDMAENSLASIGADEAAAAWGEDADAGDIGGDDHSNNGDSADDPERLHDLLRRLVGELIGQDNARLSLECLALVTGLAYCGDSMTDIGKRHGVSRAAVSKRCVELSRALNLKPSRAMRSLKARKSYSRARIRHLESQT